MTEKDAHKAMLDEGWVSAGKHRYVRHSNEYGLIYQCPVTKKWKSRESRA